MPRVQFPRWIVGLDFKRYGTVAMLPREAANRIEQLRADTALLKLWVDRQIMDIDQRCPLEGRKAHEA